MSKNIFALIPDCPIVVSAGAGIFGIVLAALILLTGVALVSYIVHGKWSNSYVRWVGAVNTLKLGMHQSAAMHANILQSSWSLYDSA